MATTLELLAMPFAQCSSAIVNELLVDGVNSEGLVLGSPMGAQDRDLSIPVSVSAAALDDPLWNFRGEVKVLYDQMDLNTFFYGIPLEILLPELSSTAELAAVLANIFKVRFDSNDYVFEPLIVTPSPKTITFKASKTSTRWKGEVRISVRTRR